VSVGVVTACPVSAQEVREPLPARTIETSSIELSPDVLTWTARVQELSQWLTEFERWQQWDEVWRNKREPGWVKTRDRRPRPDPPSWLAAECADAILVEESTLATGCRQLRV